MFKIYDKKSSIDIKQGRYVSGGTTDIFPKRLGWWERDLSFMDRQLDDIYFSVTNKEERRIDLISQAVYQRADLGWLILQYNNIVDINEEIVAGVTLVMPNPFRAMFDITS